jgi:hypothetical protein
MTLDDFRQSLQKDDPPAELTLALVGLWWDAKGDWTRAHESAQQDEGVDGSWVHAYLHRKEGDQSNAAYWYSRAGKPVCRESSKTGSPVVLLKSASTIVSLSVSLAMRCRYK